MIENDLTYSKSFSVHIALVIFMIAFQYINLSNPLKVDSKKTKKVFIKQAIRVDVVGMPKHTLKELKAMKVQPAVQEPKAEPAPIEKNVTPPTPSENDFFKKKKKTSFKDLIKGLSKKKIDKPKTKSKGKGKGRGKSGKGKSNLINNKRLNKLILEGNKISKGSSLTGVQVAQADYGAFENYIAQLPDHVRPYWKLPSYLMDKELKCRIQVFINGSGELVRVQLVESSNDSEYDSKALQAVKDSAPFPRPEASFVGMLIQGEVILGFPL
jgi:colicin import membrane protein